jgi:hypothetical protein
VLASAVGWVIVALIVVWFFGIVIGTLRFVLRSVVWIVLIALLLAAYFSLKTPPDS